ncbi:MAG: peptidoglycan DD-metalloendopeptidase family protein [Anaerolineaceae bacterium]|nr:MAG: peptidoglycan DD-metalloendopeptidase family protein [Anaerolineaceae bacterium]
MKSGTRIILISLLVVLAIPISSALAQESGPIYIVQPGDTLIYIAAVFGTTVEALADANGIEDPSLLIPGTELIIPGYEDISGVLTFYGVDFGENLFSLSLRYRISIDGLARLNRLVNPGQLYAGQPLIVPEKDEAASEIPNVSLHLPILGESKLEMAVRAGINPWSLSPLSGGGIRSWIVPGVPVVTPGGDGWSGALPSPYIEASINPLLTVQGRTTVFRVAINGSGWLSGRLSDRQLHFFPHDGGYVALQGIHAMQNLGLYNCELDLYSTEGGELIYSFSQPVRVLDGGYGFENINGVPAETVDPEVTGPERAMVEALLAEATQEKQWEGTFQYPSDYYTESFVSIYGTRRSYNWGAFDFYHTGLDLYGSIGLPILAPAPGRVVFAGPLIVRGNATYIDHGWGVYSGYFHQSKIFVSVGDWVETGQVIGEVGNTGRSTGPHMHWEIWVGGVPVNPLEWVENGFP